MTVAEVLGSVLGVIGALMVASNSRATRWAFPVYLVSNVSLLIFGVAGGHWGIAAANAAFALIAIYGICRWSK